MMTNAIKWFKQSLEGTDGKASSKALSLFWIIILVTALHVVFMYLAIRISEKVVATEASLKVMDRLRDLIGINLTVMLILFGVVTIQTLIQALRAFRGQPLDPEPVFTETKTSTTTTEIKPKVHETIQPINDSTNQPNG